MESWVAIKKKTINMYKNINVKILRGLKKISESKCGKIKRNNKSFFYFNNLILFLFAHFF